MDNVPAAISLVLVLGMAAQWLAWRAKLPSILLLLTFGFLAGRVFHPDKLIGQDLLFPLVSLAVATILLEGGLSLSFREIRETRRAVLRLCTVGVAIAWGLTMVAARFLVDMTWSIAALLGAILVVTGPTVIGPLLRQIKPIRSVGAVAKWEGIVVDPLGAVLAVLVFQAVMAQSRTHAFTGLGWSLLKLILVGGLGGFLVAKGLEVIFKRHLIPDFLHSPTLLAVSLAAYTVSNEVQSEMGLFTVTILGIALANQNNVSLEHIVEFKETLRVLLISCLFIILAARIELGEVTRLGLRSLWFLLALIFVVRPASVWLSTYGSGLGWKQRLYLCFLAPRGIVAAAVTSVFAIELIEAAERYSLPAALVADAAKLVPLTFVVIIGTVAFYGLLAGPLARRLKLAAANPQGILFVGARPWVIEVAKCLREAGIEVLLVDTSPEIVARARMANLPALHANILSRFVSEELELFGIGRLLAVTSNFEVNTLACGEFISQFGRQNVYQLQFKDTASQRRDLSHRMRGRPLFAEKFTHDVIAEWIAGGAVVKKTQITDKYSYADFRARYGEVLPLFAISGPGKVTVFTSDSPEPGAGTTLISLIRQMPEEAPVSESDERSARA